MAKSVFVLLNHQLTDRQRIELVKGFSCAVIEQTPAEAAQLWSAIPAEGELSGVPLEPITNWLGNASPGDVVVVQGEMGATFAVVTWALRRSLVPVYATTRRVAQEMRIGERVTRTHVFEHVQFRRYKEVFDEVGD
jgi:hypothetical protein